ncbi:MAG: TetR/AcrR family transcriptional regulator [Pseudomonadota bacterium]
MTELGVRERQKRETRASILQAALDQFAERGFDGASIRDIAKRAGVFHGLIKYHFENKEELWKAAVSFLFERQATEMANPEGFDDLPPAEQARNWLRRYVHYCAHHPEHARIMVQESLRDSERLRWAVKEHIAPVHEIARDVSSRWMQAGIYPAIPYHAIIYIISSSAQAPFMLAPEVRHSSGVDVMNTAQIDAYADALITMLFDHKIKD